MAEEAILTYLDKNELIVDSGEFAVEAGLGHEEVINAIKSLKGSKYVDTQVFFLSHLLYKNKLNLLANENITPFDQFYIYIYIYTAR